jgi:putative ABC transport system ATP-binding protein
MKTLEANELYRFFHPGGEEVKALRGVDFSVQSGEMIALVGPSGSGKSTLLMCLTGLDEPDGGGVKVMGTTITRRPEIDKTRLRSKYLGVMLQKNNLFAHLTVAENMGAAQAMVGRRDDALVNQILQRVRLTDRSSALPAQLSGGERARAGLAVSLCRKPEILVLDEPTGEVDADTETEILSVLEDHRRAGGSIVVATHNSAIARNANQILTMRDGRIFNG